MEVGVKGEGVARWVWVLAVRTPILAIRPVVSDKALALQLCRKEYPHSWKIVKQVKYVLKGGKKEYSMCG